MSRVGSQPIPIPSDVTVTINDSHVHVKGPKGELEHTLPEGVAIEEKDEELVVSVKKETSQLKALWGTNRALIANMVEGVKEGFEKKLEIHGVGYRAEVAGITLKLNVGFSHVVEIEAPEGISFAVEKNVITVSGIDKVLVGETAARIRRVRKPEPYKGKGIRYQGEYVRRKQGKKAAAAE